MIHSHELRDAIARYGEAREAAGTDRALTATQRLDLINEVRASVYQMYDVLIRMGEVNIAQHVLTLRDYDGL